MVIGSQTFRPPCFMGIKEGPKEQKDYSFKGSLLATVFMGSQTFRLPCLVSIEEFVSQPSTQYRVMLSSYILKIWINADQILINLITSHRSLCVFMRFMSFFDRVSRTYPSIKVIILFLFILCNIILSLFIYEYVPPHHHQTTTFRKLAISWRSYQHSLETSE